MSDTFIELHISTVEGNHWVYNEITDRTAWFGSADEACEHFVRLLITTGGRHLITESYSRDYLKLWLNKQPNKTELAELLDLQEMVR